MAKTEDKPTDAGALSVREVRRALGEHNISSEAIYAAMRRGSIPTIAIGSRRLVPRSWLMKQLRQSK